MSILDDPIKPEFACALSYSNFAIHVQHRRRYVWDDKVSAFLDTVLATLKDRDVTLKQGALFYRAQLGVEYNSVTNENGEEIGEDVCGHGPKRMKPLAHRAREGRANPAGVPMLYLASNPTTAVTEVRPWVGSEISLAQFKLNRTLRAIDLSRGYGPKRIDYLFTKSLDGAPLTADEKVQCVWAAIDNAFSCPITPADDTADYVPTQILAELFISVGYEAIIYRSQFGIRGYNIALTSAAAADPINCTPCNVTSIEIKYGEIGNPWFSADHNYDNRNASQQTAVPTTEAETTICSTAT